MARKRRKDEFDPRVRGTYHITSRCVRGAWLLSNDRRDRRAELRKLLEELAGIYAISILIVAFLSNHFHLVLTNLPDLVDSWNDDEVILRAQRAFPHRFACMGIHGPPNDDQMEVLLRKKKMIREMRRRLSDISWMMRMLKQRFAVQVNREEERTGHFWEGRFKMVEIVSQTQLITTMIYVAVNQIRAGMSTSLDTSLWTSVCWQLQARELREAGDEEAADARDGFLAPLSAREPHPASDGGEFGSRRASDEGTLDITLDEFVRLAELAVAEPAEGSDGNGPELAELMERVGVTMAALMMAIDGIL